MEIKELERIVSELLPATQQKYSVLDLYTNGYEPHHRTFRKQVLAGIYICYRECNPHDGYFEFAAIMSVKGGD